MKAFLSAVFYVGDEWFHRDNVTEEKNIFYVNIISHQGIKLFLFLNIDLKG